MFTLPMRQCCQANKINIAQIVAQDEVTLRGVGDTVYSITVDKGHGYITFQGVDAFIGGYASIGTKQLFEVTSGMLTTTQEGTYTVEAAKGKPDGNKDRDSGKRCFRDSGF